MTDRNNSDGKTYTRPRGAFFTEILVALLFFFICMTAMLGVIGRAQRLSEQSRSVTMASAAAQSVMEDILASPQNADSVVYLDGTLARCLAEDAVLAALCDVALVEGVYSITVNICSCSGGVYDSAAVIYTLTSAEAA